MCPLIYIRNERRFGQKISLPGGGRCWRALQLVSLGSPHKPCPEETAAYVDDVRTAAMIDVTTAGRSSNTGSALLSACSAMVAIIHR